MNFTEITSIIGIGFIGFAVGRLIEAIFHSINKNKKEENGIKK
jgi:hypothetical protein